MFIEFHAVSRPEGQSGIREATRFEIYVEVNGKRELYSEVIPNEALVLEGYVDAFFNRFISKFKGAAAQVLNKGSGGTVANRQ